MTVLSIRDPKVALRVRQELTVLDTLEEALFGENAISTKLLAKFILNDLEDVAAEEASLGRQDVPVLAVKPRIRVPAISGS
jgi:hypothetical protein